jgi:hypothetical protein
MGKIEVTEIRPVLKEPDKDCPNCHGTGLYKGSDIYCPCKFSFAKVDGCTEIKKMVDIEYQPTADGGMQIKLDL